MMNLLYCGDKNIERGLYISVLSILKHVKEPLAIYVLTMAFVTDEKVYQPVSKQRIKQLEERVQQVSSRSFIRVVNVAELFQEAVPKANLHTLFTPYCMLRLFADLVEELPEHLFYLDNDVVCNQDFGAFYHQDMTGYEVAGVLDYYGSWFFRRKWYRRDYLNSGVLLLNLKEIRKTGLFEQCRKLCREKKMLLPDQSALNRLCSAKKICPRKYNEQRKLKPDTALQHFTTSFRFFPFFHVVKVKPWQIQQVHDTLKLFAYDDILAEYRREFGQSEV